MYEWDRFCIILCMIAQMNIPLLASDAMFHDCEILRIVMRWCPCWCFAQNIHVANNQLCIHVLHTDRPSWCLRNYSNKNYLKNPTLITHALKWPLLSMRMPGIQVYTLCFQSDAIVCLSYIYYSAMCHLQ